MNNYQKCEKMKTIKIFVLNGEDGMEKEGYKYFVMFNPSGGIYMKSLRNIEKNYRIINNQGKTTKE